MKSLFAIAKLTIKAAFRFRLVVLLGALLLISVVILPIMIKHDGTAQGFIQILLTYNLSVITALLGFSTLWLACGTLARDVEEGQIQMVVVKPVPRWQVWLGKWLGIMALNGMLLAVAGGAVFALLHWRADRLPKEEQQTLQKEVLVARGSLKPPKPNIKPVVDKLYKKELKARGEEVENPAALRKQIEERVKRRIQLIPPHRGREWSINVQGVKEQIRDKPLFVRFKFQTAEESYRPGQSRSYPLIWEFGPENAAHERRKMKLAPGSFHEFEIPPNLFTKEGELPIRLENHTNTSFLVPMTDGIEVLFRQGGFATNYIRGLLIVYCWLALLAAIGLFAASFLTFPVAAFCAIGILMLGFSTGTMQSVVEEQSVLGVNHVTGEPYSPLLDSILIPVYSKLLDVVQLVRDFSPIDSLSTGRMISWVQLGKAISQIVLLIGGIFGLLGAVIFSFRELAMPQS